ncbi:Taste receptor type 1 member 1 [Bagarius yarrelli]|uniref:Taste receptor type 1 member 1 n=1 Tax=Bagarius yarrelli TaxID=175774 RepID=A0A556U2B9_BAGYA|nr:Taste receptor type 1 member 1 [Bagarius yarrelli]
MGELMFQIVLLVCFWGSCYGTGLYEENITIYGMFPLHNVAATISTIPQLTDCNRGTENSHGYYLVQALRYAVEEINNDTQLLPGITLNYQTFDTCSLQASILGTVTLLAQQFNRVKVKSNAIALVGPDSSSYSFTPAAALGSFLMPQISYEASNELLSNKQLYPSFFRTIPSDKNQVKAMLEILVRYNWTWIALLGSDNSYGLQGMLSLSQHASDYNICIAYKAVIPILKADTQLRMQNIVKNIIKTKVNTIVVFSSKRIAKGFFPFVIEQNVTGKVWIGSEDWSVATLVSQIPGISSIGTVLGVSVKSTHFYGFQDFVKRNLPKSINSLSETSVACLQNSSLFGMATNPLSEYDKSSSFNAYRAVYAVAYALHKALGCDSEKCPNTEIQPWQLFHHLKQVRVSIRNTTLFFDQYGNPPTGYDIVTWLWINKIWSLGIVGSFISEPPSLVLNASEIQWHHTDCIIVYFSQMPESRCSPECPFGHRQLQIGQHKCCFKCIECPASTFLNKTGSTSCQSCNKNLWSPSGSEDCLQRTVLYLQWDDPLAIVLLVLLALTLLLTLSTALTFLLNMTTPVVKSAGGKTCLLMLLSLTIAACSSMFLFSKPTQASCIFRKSLFIFSFNICLTCMTVRAFQVVCIFKWSAKLPKFYDTWAKNRGPDIFILVTSLIEFFIAILCTSLKQPLPSADYDFYFDKTVLECNNTMVVVLPQILYVSILTVICFCLSYMGKDLPANYSEAKCITFSLMIYIISWISFFTTYSVNRGTLSMALEVVAVLSSVLGILGGYFMPKLYIIILQPKKNTTAHFQNCIQMYTMAKQ